MLVYLFEAQGVDPRGLGGLLAAISWPGVAGFLLVSLAALVLRAGRYWLLLDRRAAFGPLLLVTLVRNLFVDLVPMRAGAAASYLYLVTARLGLPVEAGVASFALAFILDTLALAPLLVLAVLFAGTAPIPPLWLVAGSLVVLAGSVAPGRRARGGPPPGPARPGRRAHARRGRRGRAAGGPASAHPGARPFPPPPARQVRRLLLPPPGAPGRPGAAVGEPQLRPGVPRHRGSRDGRVAAAPHHRQLRPL
ncbi:MAG: hypothetical protein DMD79_24670 [Candidatus Rokuibacteriota bacterium]|nr:MAG: hypothetical protein DMD79_24670 [Candidatus Rokubacteria bacterium]